MPDGEEITLQGYKTKHDQAAPDNLKMLSLIKKRAVLLGSVSHRRPAIIRR